MVAGVEWGLLIAAGGGGDAIAAALLHHALGRGDSRPAIATYSWDRLLIDPLPGPRDPSSFSRLERVGKHNFRLTGETAARAPAGSTLPRLAAELDADLFLLDPRDGALGLREQLSELRDLLDAPTVTIVDVGGDILAHGDEPALRSPLADALVLAATAALSDCHVLVTGAGLDGELAEPVVYQRYEQVGARIVGRLSPADTEPFRPLFEWHPSEATGLLCAAAAGARGTAEIRDSGLRVALTDKTIDIAHADHAPVLRVNRLAQQLVATHTLEEAEAVLRATGRTSEIEYERRKARQQQQTRAATSGDNSSRQAVSAHRLAEERREAARRGTDFITLRGLAERLGIPGDQLADLQGALRSEWPDDYDPPVWTVHSADQPPRDEVAWNGRLPPAARRR